MNPSTLYPLPFNPGPAWSQSPVKLPEQCIICTAEQLEDIVSTRLAARLEVERKEAEGRRYVGPVEVSKMWGITAQATRRILKREKVTRHYPGGRKARALFLLGDVERLKNTKYTREDGTFKNTVRKSAPTPKQGGN